MYRTVVLLLILGGCKAAPPVVSPRPLPTPVATQPRAPRERTEPWQLAPEQLAHVADASGAFPSMLGTPGPRLVLAVLDEPPSFVEPDVLGVHEVDDEALAELGLARPPAVWLVTPRGACQASLGGGYVGHYADGPAAYEVGFHLEPCAPGFGPLAVVAEEVPPELRWVAAKVELDERVALDTWAHPLRDRFVELGLGTHRDEADQFAPARWARVVSVPGTPLRQLVAADHWPAEEPCDEHEVVTIGTGLWDGEALRWLPVPESLAWGPEDPQLVGAVVDGDVPVAVVHTVRFQAGVGLRDATGHYTWFELDTGRYHDEDVAFSGYSVQQYCGP